MGNLSVLAIFLSLSLTTSSQFPLKPQPKATPSDLLSLLGPTSQSSKLDPLISSQLNSCFKFLVPFTPTSLHKRTLRSTPVPLTKRQHQNELVWWPPQPVLELARLAFDSGADPDSVYRALDPTVVNVPDVEGSKQNRCQLTRTPYGRRFISEELNSYLEFLFQLIVARGPEVGFNVKLSRYDLFHGHLFLAVETGRLGILFHAREYPLYDKEVFPYNLGYCQRGVLLVLDARPGGIIYRDIIPDYVKFARTIYEDYLGNVAVDVNYLNVGDMPPNYQIFIC